MIITLSNDYLCTYPRMLKHTNLHCTRLPTGETAKSKSAQTYKFQLNTWYAHWNLLENSKNTQKQTSKNIFNRFREKVLRKHPYNCRDAPLLVGGLMIVSHWSEHWGLQEVACNDQIFYIACGLVGWLAIRPMNRLSERNS